MYSTAPADWTIYKLGLTSDYHLYDPIKERLKSKIYASDEEVKTAVMKWVKEQSTEFYETEIHALIQMWKIAIERSGYYVNK